MKKKESNKKLSLNKTTISNLDSVKGGILPDPNPRPENDGNNGLPHGYLTYVPHTCDCPIRIIGTKIM